MSAQPIRNFVILGVTNAGKRFRPSDWADRLCGIMSSFGSERRMTYSPHVTPGCWISGEKCVFVSAALYDVEPLAYHFLVHFARDNELQVSYDHPANA
jgi:hypothetical protein